MNKLFFLFAACFLFAFSPLKSQNIKDLFIDFPESILGEDPNRENRRKFLNSTSEGETGVLSGNYDSGSKILLKILDVPGGYMYLDFYDVFYQMCYWKKSDGSKLVAVCETGTHGYLDSEVKFFNYFDGKWTRLNTDSIFPKPIVEDLLDKKATVEANNGKAIPDDKVFDYATNITLPQKGKDILVELELIDADEEYLEYDLILKKQLKDRRKNFQITYQWNDGTFIKPK